MKYQTNYGTSYEIIVSNGIDKLLVMYSGKKTLRCIMDGLILDNFKRLKLTAKKTKSNEMDWEVRDDGLITCGTWAIYPSGRTKYQVFVEKNELESIYDQNEVVA